MQKIFSQIQVLSDAEIEQIHSNSLKIMKEVGCYLPEKRILKLFEKAGAAVDHVRGIVKFPPKLVEETLEKVRCQRTSLKEKPSPLDTIKERMGISTWIVDHRTGRRRYGLVKDIPEAVAVGNQLENIGYVSAFVVPHDIPPPFSDVVSFAKVLPYTSKLPGSARPGPAYIFSAQSAKYIIEMAKVIGAKLNYPLEPISPLRYRKESLEIALEFAKNDFTIQIGPMVTAGSSGPVTLAGTLTLQNAEILIGVLLIHLLNPNQKEVVYGGIAHTLDLSTAICSCGCPNHVLLGLAQIQMAKRYGLSCRVNLGLTDSNVPDFQGGFEQGLGAVLAFLAGAERISPRGLVGADQAVSLVQLVIDNEFISYLNRLLKGIKVGEDTIAFEVIKKVGIGGNFLVEDHTLKHMREEIWPSSLFLRKEWTNWSNTHSKTLIDLALEKVKNILSKDYPPKPVVEEDKLREIEKLCKECTKITHSNKS